MHGNVERKSRVWEVQISFDDLPLILHNIIILKYMQSLMWDSLGEGRECCERQTETETDRVVIWWRSGDSVGTRAEFNIK